MSDDSCGGDRQPIPEPTDEEIRASIEKTEAETRKRHRPEWAAEAGKLQHVERPHRADALLYVFADARETFNLDIDRVLWQAAGYRPRDYWTDLLRIPLTRKRLLKVFWGHLAVGAPGEQRDWLGRWGGRRSNLRRVEAVLLALPFPPAGKEYGDPLPVIRRLAEWDWYRNRLPPSLMAFARSPQGGDAIPEPVTPAAPPAAKPGHSPSGNRGRKTGSGEYDDRQHLRDMLERLRQGQAASVYAAATEIAATGGIRGAAQGSIQRRLYDKFRKRLGTTPPQGKSWNDVEV